MSTQEFLKFSAKWREALFLDMARRPDGTSAHEVFDAAVAEGDRITVEAFHNLGRRLSHRGILIPDKSERQTKYRLNQNTDGQWLDEDQLGEMINPTYPLISLTVIQEASRQLNDIDESVWYEIRERLKSVEARSLFKEAIIGYCDNLVDEIAHYISAAAGMEGYQDLPKLFQHIENEISMLRGVVYFGLGLSSSAVKLPKNVFAAIKAVKEEPSPLHFYEQSELESELARRVEEGPVVRQLDPIQPNHELLIAAVDGSSRSGVTSPNSEFGDFSVGSYPIVSINTAVCQVNRFLQTNDTKGPVFFRLPEKPEDMQQSDNRHTIMAKIFYPDITDGEYIHSVWNAMDTLESKASLKALRRWYTSSTGKEIRAADILFRDGTVVPQERDFTHYIQQDSYGKISRDLIEVNWEIVKKCRDDDQTVAGVVKTANLRVIGPVINWFVSRIHLIDPATQIKAWPLPTLNCLSDQVLLSRMLSARRKKNDPWTRTCVILRPFHAVTKYAQSYSKEPQKTPIDYILARAARSFNTADVDVERDDTWLKSDEFRGKNDPYVKLLGNCWYAGCYICSLPRLDLNNTLPRCEFVLPEESLETGVFPTLKVDKHLQRLLVALKTVDFDVSADHSMFQDSLKIDILPSLLIRVHDTVKIWATELVSRVNEYIGFLISKRVISSKQSGIRVRPWKASELKKWNLQLQMERDLQAGNARLDSSEALPPTER